MIKGKFFIPVLLLWLGVIIILATPNSTAQISAAPTDRNYNIIAPTIDEVCTGDLCSRRIYSNPQYLYYNGDWIRFTDAGTFIYDETLGLFSFNAAGKRVDLDVFAIYNGRPIHFSSISPLLLNQLAPTATIDKTKLLKFGLNVNRIDGLTAIGFKLRNNENCYPVKEGFVCGQLQIDFSDLKGEATYTLQRADTITPNGTTSRQEIKSISYNKTITQNRTHLWVDLHSGLNVLDPRVFGTGTNATGNRMIWKARTFDMRDNNLWNNSLGMTSGLGYRQMNYLAINATAALPTGIVVKNATLFIYSTLGATGPGAATMEMSARACNQTAERTTSIDSCEPDVSTKIMNHTLVPKTGWNKFTNMSYVINQSYYGHTNPANKVGKHSNISIWLQNDFATAPVANISFNILGTQREPYIEIWYRSQQTARFFECSAASEISNEAVALNFTFYDEINRSKFNITKFAATFSALDVNNVSAKFNMSFSKQNRPSYVAICISPANHTYRTNATIKYEKDGFDFRHYYMHSKKDNLTSTKQNINLYMLQDTKSALISLLVTDALDAPLKDILTEIQKYFTANNSYITTAMIKSGEDGKDAVYLQQDETDYRFRLYQNGKLVKTTTGQKLTATTYTIKITPSSLTDLISNINDLVTNLTYNNHTKTFRFGFYDPNSKMAGACLQSSISNNTGTYFRAVNCSYGSFRGFLHSRPGNSTISTSTGYGYIVMNGSILTFGKQTFQVIQGLHQNSQTWGKYGLFLLMMLIVGVVMTQIASPTSVIVTLMVTLFVAWWMDIFSVTTLVFTSLMIGLGVLIKELRSG